MWNSTNLDGFMTCCSIENTSSLQISNLRVTIDIVYQSLLLLLFVL